MTWSRKPRPGQARKARITDTNQMTFEPRDAARAVVRVSLPRMARTTTAIVLMTSGRRNHRLKATIAPSAVRSSMAVTTGANARFTTRKARSQGTVRGEWPDRYDGIKNHTAATKRPPATREKTHDDITRWRRSCSFAK